MAWSDQGLDDGGQYYYDMGFAVSPTNADSVFWPELIFGYQAMEVLPLLVRQNGLIHTNQIMFTRIFMI